MKFAFRDTKIIFNFSLGIFWLIYGIAGILWIDEEVTWRDYGSIVIGILFLGISAYQYFWNFVLITDEKIILNYLPKQEIVIDDLSAAEYKTPNYVFRTLDKEIYVTKSQIRKKDLPKFEEVFEQIKKKIELQLS